VQSDVAANLGRRVPTRPDQFPNACVPTGAIAGGAEWEDHVQGLPVRQALLPRKLSLGGRPVEAAREALDELVGSEQRPAEYCPFKRLMPRDKFGSGVSTSRWK
jgi:hypothetical protein